MRSETIRIHVDAPAKPAVGAACNGCGLCCLAEPCPAGQLLTLRRHGSCRLLRWDETGSRYRCGLFGDEASSVARRPLAALAHRLRRRLATRWIAAGAGCDAEVVALPAD